MSRKVIHAPDGGSVPGALCQERSGDVTTSEHDVDCGECLDALERSDQTFEQLARPLSALRRFIGY